ncbi:hypothetical protein D3C74_260200 [compost metagenome]
MRYPDQRLALRRAEDRRQQLAFGARIETDRRLIEDEHRRILQEDPRQGHALPFAAGEPPTRFTHRRVHPPRQRCNQRAELRRLRGPADLLVRRLRTAEPNVVRHRRVEQVGALVQDGDHLRHPVAVGGGWDTVDLHRPVARGKRALDQLQQRRLAGAAAADHHHPLALRKIQRDAVYRIGVFRRVGEADVPQPHVSGARDGIARRSGHRIARRADAGTLARDPGEPVQRHAVLRRALHRFGHGQKRVRQREHDQHERRDQRGVDPSGCRFAAGPVYHRDHDEADDEMTDEAAPAGPSPQFTVLASHCSLILLIRREEFRRPPADHPIADPHHGIGQLLVQPVPLALNLLVCPPR